MEDTKTDPLPTVDDRLERIEGMLSDLRDDLATHVEKRQELAEELETRVQLLYDVLERVREQQERARGQLARGLKTELDRARYDIGSLNRQVSSLERNSR